MVDFPNNPIDRQEHNENGTQWIYRDPPGGWEVVNKGVAIEIVEADAPAGWQVWGDVLIQWGGLSMPSSPQTITFPQPFKYSPRITASSSRDNGSGVTMTTLDTISATDFNLYVTRGYGTAASFPVNARWIAVGEAPDTLKKTKTVTGAGGDSMPIGSVTAFAGSNIPAKWLLCDGSTINRVSYAELFAAIGETYGAGDGSTTFSIPDMRGEFVRGFDDGRGIDVGRVLGSFQWDALEDHQHLESVRSSAGGTQTGDGFLNGSWFTLTSGVQNGRVAAETRPRNVAMNYIIKALY